MNRVRTSVTLVALLMCSPIAARADAVLDWNAIAVSTLVSQGQSPFAQARFMAITQLAVFEAVNAITGDYKPYLGTARTVPTTTTKATAMTITTAACTVEIKDAAMVVALLRAGHGRYGNDHRPFPHAAQTPRERRGASDPA